MGKLIRLDTNFSGAGFPKLVDYDFARYRDQLLAYPTLRGFFDAAQVVTTSGRVTQMTDLSGNGRHFVQATTSLAPAASTINGQPGVYFDGTREMKAAGLFSGANEQSVAMMIYAPDAAADAMMVMAEASLGSYNFYVRSNRINAISGGNTLFIDVAGTLLHYKAGWNSQADTSTLYGNELSNVGDTAQKPAPAGAANLGRWSDSNNTAKFIGHIGYVAVFDEDISKNAYLRRLLDTYARSRFRTTDWVA